MLTFPLPLPPASASLCQPLPARLLVEHPGARLEQQTAQAGSRHVWAHPSSTTRLPRASAASWTGLEWRGGSLGIYWLSFAASKWAGKGKGE